MRNTLLMILVACGNPSSGPESPEVAPGAGPPSAERRPVTDTYHGVAVEDPYQWLEGDADEVKAWSEGQNRYARGILDGLPDVDDLRAEITAILTAPVMAYFSLESAGGVLFALRKDPTKQQPELIQITDPDHAEAATLILDPTSGAGANQTIDWFVASPDGSRIAVSLSEGGSENGTLHLVDPSGKDLEAPIPDVQRGTGGGDVAWTPDGKGFFYTRYPAAGEKPEEERNFWMQVWYHELGTPAKDDRYEIGKDLPKIAEILLEADARGRVLASIQKGDGGEFQHHLRDEEGHWRQLTDWADEVVHVGFGPSADLLLISRKGAPRSKILRLPAAATELSQAELVVPEGKEPIVADYYDEWGVVSHGDRLYVTYQTGGPSELRVFSLDGKPLETPALPPVSSLGKPVRWKDSVLVRAVSYITPSTWYLVSASSPPKAIASLSPPPPVDLSSFEVRRETATSKDGTRVPLNIVWPKDAPKDGTTPCVVTGYGGFNSSREPSFLGKVAPMLTRGVCYVDANLRGGGEFGEDWHRGGMLTHKQNVFDDFAAVMTYVVEQRYTSRERLAIMGGSNGGLLMGAMITQHPDLMKAVVSQVGIYDMLRVELSSNGQYNVPEYGTVADQAQFTAMFAYSPYHHVTAGTTFPAMLFTTGANDPRVEPWHSRKMVAALQAAHAGNEPILLRTSADSGHGMGTPMTEVIELQTHVQAFVLSQLE